MHRALPYCKLYLDHHSPFSAIWFKEDDFRVYKNIDNIDWPAQNDRDSDAGIFIMLRHLVLLCYWSSFYHCHMVMILKVSSRYIICQISCCNQITGCKCESQTARGELLMEVWVIFTMKFNNEGLSVINLEQCVSFVHDFLYFYWTNIGMVMACLLKM